MIYKYYASVVVHSSHNINFYILGEHEISKHDPSFVGPQTPYFQSSARSLRHLVFSSIQAYTPSGFH